MCFLSTCGIRFSASLQPFDSRLKFTEPMWPWKNCVPLRRRGPELWPVADPGAGDATPPAVWVHGPMGGLGMAGYGWLLN